ncbi:c-type cytochrome [Inquilinus sp.]|jgi:cytochrome c553|uniref:c-type cytochrome n=1 Tax=Inquilinus sp. TaxID=1932117 RepID=UPI00378391DB
MLKGIKAGLALLAVAGTAVSGAAWAAGDSAAGRAKARQCAACHGANGVAKMPNVPNIAGESPIYLEKQLKAFRGGERADPQMSVIAKPLSDQDIADLAAWYASIKVTVTVPE